jgi:hypothetical protein
MSAIPYWAAIAGFVTSLLAAVFWFCAAVTRIPPFPDVGFDSNSKVFEPVRKALQRASMLNAIAAGFATLAAISAAIVFACQKL